MSNPSKYTISLKHNMHLVWSLNLNNYELFLGMIAAGIGIMGDIKNNSTYFLEFDTDITKSQIATNIQEEDLPLYQIPDDYYGLWLKSTKRFFYNLFIFRTGTFYQGIISMAEAFSVDFRNYIYSKPFDNKGNKYTLDKYLLPYDHIQLTWDAPDFQDVPELNNDEGDFIGARPMIIN